jgi:dTDP-glucose pyrophosphorylase
MLIPWQPLSLKSTDTLKDALRNLDDNALQIVLIVDDNQRLVGTLTDGDIRRALLNEVSLSASVALAMNKQPVIGFDTETPFIWKQKLQGRKIRHLPIVDSEMGLIQLFYDRPIDISGLPYPVVLMLGGLGTRLYPLTQTVPKPMLKVGNRPILEHIIETLVEQGFREFYFCINYLGHMIRDYFGNGERWGVSIHYVEEDQRMGTAGALSLLPHRMQTPFLVMNGDLLTKLDFKDFMNFHHEQKAVATMCVREHEHQIAYGVVELKDQLITRVLEKPIYRYWVNAGIYALSPQALDWVPTNSFYDMPTLIDQLIEQKMIVSAYQLQDYWLDIGQMKEFEQAQADFDVHFVNNLS